MLILSILMIAFGVIFLVIGGLSYNICLMMLGTIMLIGGVNMNVEIKISDLSTLCRKLKLELDELKEKNK